MSKRLVLLVVLAVAFGIALQTSAQEETPESPRYWVYVNIPIREVTQDAPEAAVFDCDFNAGIDAMFPEDTPAPETDCQEPVSNSQRPLFGLLRIIGNALGIGFTFG